MVIKLYNTQNTRGRKLCRVCFALVKSYDVADLKQRVSELKLALLEDFDGDNIRNDEVDDYGDG